MKENTPKWTLSLFYEKKFNRYFLNFKDNIDCHRIRQILSTQLGFGDQTIQEKVLWTPEDREIKSLSSKMSSQHKNPVH